MISVRRIIVICLLALGFVCSNVSIAATSVWKVSRGNSHVFIGGTIHVLKRSDYPLPNAFDQAYVQADTLVLETDLSSISQAHVESLILAKAFYPPGQDLQQKLDVAAFGALKHYCESVGIPMESLFNMRPGLVVMTISVTELRKLGVDQIGVDAFFEQKALQDKKPIDALETIDQQIAFIAEMGRGYESQLITQSLEELKTLATDIDQIRLAWRNGDVEAMSELVITPMKQDSPRVYRQLIVDRNRQWLGAIEQYMASPSSELILVGAAHLAGPDSLLKALKRKGFTIEQMD